MKQQQGVTEQVPQAFTLNTLPSTGSAMSLAFLGAQRNSNTLPFE
jgi:hypothetical protein